MSGHFGRAHLERVAGELDHPDHVYEEDGSGTHVAWCPACAQNGLAPR